MELALSTGSWVAIGAGAVVVALDRRHLQRNRAAEEPGERGLQRRRRAAEAAARPRAEPRARPSRPTRQHERETLEEVVEARGAAESAEALGDRQQTENGLSRSLDKLIALVERYPELKADGNFRRLHGDLVQIEDDLQYARRYYNGTVRDHNTRIQQFPAAVLAALLAAKPRDFFEIEDPAERGSERISFDDVE